MDALILPQQFGLLLHLPNGSPYVAADYTGAAELGELALRGEIEIEEGKVRIARRGEGAPEWASEVLDAVERQAGPKEKAVDVGSLLWARRSSIKTHRAALLERGLLTHRHRKVLGLFPENRYYPDETARGELLRALRDAAARRRELDDRLAPLCALVAGSGLAYGLGFRAAERDALKEVASGEHLGDAVEESVSAATMAAVTMVTTAAVTTVITSS